MAVIMEREQEQPSSSGSPLNDDRTNGCLSHVVQAAFAASSSSSPPSAARSGGSGCLSLSLTAPPPSSAQPASAAAPDGQAQEQQQQGGSVPMKWFEQARQVKRSALLVAGLQILSRFLGFFALTWATVVLLGGFASNLRRYDFYLVSALLLAEGTRLFIVQIFSKLISRILFREPSAPEDFKFKDEQPTKAMQLDLLGQSLGLVLAVASLSSTAVRLAVRHSHHLSERKPPDNGFSNLPSSLCIFYTLVILNSAFAIVSSLLRPSLRLSCCGTSIMRVPCCPWSFAQIPASQDSLTCYHDAVYSTAMEAGLPEADQLELVEYTFQKIASDLKRNIRPLLVADRNKEMIKYLYKETDGIGIAMACKHLKGPDLWRQVAAANLPGFWAEENGIEKQVALFWGLRKRMYGAWKDAGAALNSVECLARKWAVMPPQSSPHPFLIDDPKAGTNIVDTLVDLLLNTIRPTLLFQTRAFEACCRDTRVLSYLYEKYARELCNERIDGKSPLSPAEPLSKGSISKSLQELLLPEGSRQKKGAAAATASAAKLGKLCMTLHGIVQGGKRRGIWSVTQIYASKALLSLLLHGCSAEGLSQETMSALRKAVDEGIKFRSDGDRPTNVYFAKADVEAMEVVRWWLGLTAFDGWHDLRIEDLRARRLSQADVDNLVMRARESDEASHFIASTQPC